MSETTIEHVPTEWAVENASNLRYAAASESLLYMLGAGHGCLHVMNSSAEKLESLARERDVILRLYVETERDAARYRRLRENWIDCEELSLHGRLAAVDVVVDAAMQP
jgi:5-methylcytosine-specific restriction endonuclease McrBC regulatory subunit McrC